MTDTESFIKVPSDFADTMMRVAYELHVPNMVVVGGAVRDCVLGQITGRVVAPKDIDVILPKPINNIASNTNIIGFRKNSLGGLKIETKHFGTIDVFQQYTEEPEFIIAKYFDFNCNSLFYRTRDNAIISSMFFQEFLESRTIRPLRVFYDADKVWGTYGIPQTVMRALKFQINFMEKYNIKTNISSDILYMIYNMNKCDEDNMKKYMTSHVKDMRLQNLILQNYQNIRK